MAEIAGDILSALSGYFWKKDHCVSLTRDGDQYRLSARPRSALIHMAVADTATQMEQELQVCRRLDAETNFGFLKGSSRKLPHRWDLSQNLIISIRPLDGVN